MAVIILPERKVGFVRDLKKWVYVCVCVCTYGCMSEIVIIIVNKKVSYWDL